jgi:hypothetical protein
VAESAVVLKKKNWVRAERGIHCVPVNGVREIDIKIGDDWLTLPRHVRWR